MTSILGVDTNGNLSVNSTLIQNIESRIDNLENKTIYDVTRINVVNDDGSESHLGVSNSRNWLSGKTHFEHGEICFYDYCKTHEQWKSFFQNIETIEAKVNELDRITNNLNNQAIKSGENIKIRNKERWESYPDYGYIALQNGSKDTSVVRVDSSEYATTTNQWTIHHIN